MDIKKNNENEKILENFNWKTREYINYPKSENWFWILGLLVILGVVISIIIHNFLLVILILISGFVIAIYSVKAPEIMEVNINSEGVKIKNDFFPFENIDSFAIAEENYSSKVIFHLKKSWLYKDIDIEFNEDFNIEELRIFLVKKKKLEEVNYEKKALEALMEFIGF